MFHHMMTVTRTSSPSFTVVLFSCHTLTHCSTLCFLCTTSAWDFSHESMQ